MVSGESKSGMGYFRSSQPPSTQSCWNASTPTLLLLWPLIGRNSVTSTGTASCLVSLPTLAPVEMSTYLESGSYFLKKYPSLEGKRPHVLTLQRRAVLKSCRRCRYDPKTGDNSALPEFVTTPAPGHFWKVESVPNGFIWAIGFDSNVWMYGSSGKINKKLEWDRLVKDDQMCYIYENQRWNPLTGMRKRGMDCCNSCQFP